MSEREPVWLPDLEAHQRVDVVLHSNVTLWHARPGVARWGFWYPGTRARRAHAPVVPPGLFVPTALALYQALLRIYLDRPALLDLVSNVETLGKRDTRVACAALLLVQPVAELRAVGRDLLLRESTPKTVLRVAELLQTAEIAAVNRAAGWPSLGGWKRAATHWLRAREASGLDELVLRGWKQTLVALARKVGYRPTAPRFFERLGWKQRRR